MSKPKAIVSLFAVLVACSSAAPPPVATAPPPPATAQPALPELPYCLPAALLTVDRDCAAVCISEGWAFGDCSDPKPCTIVRDGGAVQVLVTDPKVTDPGAEPPTITGRQCPKDPEI